MSTLRLTLTKKWYIMILSGKKKEEYRQIKPFWINRLTWHEFHKTIIDIDTLNAEIFANSHSLPDNDVIKRDFYEYVEFKNGYSKNAPTMIVECNGITVGNARPEWSDNFKEQCFIISLGSIVWRSI